MGPCVVVVFFSFVCLFVVVFVFCFLQQSFDDIFSCLVSFSHCLMEIMISNYFTLPVSTVRQVGVGAVVDSPI